MNEEMAMCGDLELSVKLRASGRKIAFNDRMVVRHHNRTDLAAILERKHGHGGESLRIMESQPGGFDSPSLLVDFRTFLGVDNATITGVRLSAALLWFRALRTPTVLAVRFFALVSPRPGTVAVKLFKSLCSLTWEIAMLESMKSRRA